MKPGLLFVGYGDSNWIGGLYYIKNIVFTICQNEAIVNSFRLFIITTKENRSAFVGLPQFVSIVTLPSVFKKKERLFRFMFSFFHGIRFMFPVVGRKRIALLKLFGIQGISWYPDFQHKRMPQFFSKNEIQ